MTGRMIGTALVALLATIGLQGQVGAAITPLDSSAFTHKYEADALPGGTEYTGWASGGTAITVGGGVVQYATTYGVGYEYYSTPWPAEVTANW